MDAVSRGRDRASPANTAVPVTVMSPESTSAAPGLASETAAAVINGPSAKTICVVIASRANAASRTAPGGIAFIHAVRRVPEIGGTSIPVGAARTTTTGIGHPPSRWPKTHIGRRFGHGYREQNATRAETINEPFLNRSRRRSSKRLHPDRHPRDRKRVVSLVYQKQR